MGIKQIIQLIIITSLFNIWDKKLLYKIQMKRDKSVLLLNLNTNLSLVQWLFCKIFLVKMSCFNSSQGLLFPEISNRYYTAKQIYNKLRHNLNLFADRLINVGSLVKKSKIWDMKVFPNYYILVHSLLSNS